MTFEEAEAKFRELQARVQRGEAISRAEYEDQVQQLAVQDQNGILWEISPRTGKWMYFDGAEWVSGAPPGHDNSTVMPVQVTTVPAPKPGAPPVVSAAPTPPPLTRPVAPTPAPPPPLTRPVAPTPAPPPPAPRTTPPPPAPAAALTTPTPRAAVSSPPVPRAPVAAEPSKPLARLLKEKQPPPPPPLVETPPARPSRPGPLGGKDREWVPLAIGAVVLLLCAVLLFVGGNFALSAFAPKPTATRTALPLPTNTLVPTVVRLPTQPPPTATPAPVLAKIAEATVNVRASPSTKAAIVTKLKKDTQITLVGVGPADGNNVWYQVNLPDRAGPVWIRSDTLQIVSGDPKTLPSGVPATPAPTAPAATKPPAAPQPTPTLTPIGVIPPTPKP